MTNNLGARTALVNTGLPVCGTFVNVGCVLAFTTGRAQSCSAPTRNLQRLIGTHRRAAHLRTASRGGGISGFRMTGRRQAAWRSNRPCPTGWRRK